jgi:hypothetical protein
MTDHTSSINSGAIVKAEKQCPFMDVAEQTQRYPETRIAIEHSNNLLLNIFDYIEVVRYPIDPFMLDKFWQCVNGNLRVHMDSEILGWLGYDHVEEKDRKAAFLKLLKSHTIEFKQIKHNSPEFETYPELVKEAQELSVQSIHKKKWIVMGARDFKKMVMCLRTKRADDIREYYLSIEELFRMYCEYTLHFLIHRQRIRDAAAKQENNDLIARMENMTIKQDQLMDQIKKQNARQDQLIEYAEEAKDERDAFAGQCDAIARQCDAIAEDLAIARNATVPEAARRSKQPMVCIFKLGPNYKHVSTDPDYMEHADVRIVRRQAHTVNSALKKFRELGDGTNRDAEMVHCFANPNAINLVVRLKEDYPHRFIYHPPSGVQFRSSVSATDGLDELIQTINDLHEVRLMYPEGTGTSN